MIENINIPDKEEEIKILEAELAEAESVIQRGKDLESLRLDPRFQSVILDGYIGELAEFLFDELTKPITMQSNEDYTREGLLAIRHLKSYIGFNGLKGDIEYNAETAEYRALDIQAAIDKL